MNESRALSTNKKYLTWIRDFKDFLRNYIKNEEFSIENACRFIAFRSLMGRSSGIQTFKFALKAELLALGLEDFSHNAKIASTLKGVERRLSKTSPAKRIRDAMPVETIVKHMLNQEASKSPLWLRDCTALAIGTRCMSRPSEVVALKANDVIDKGQFIEVRIRFTKVDQLGKGTFIAIEKLQDPRICPASFILRLIKCDGISGEDWIFRTANGNKLSPAALSSMIKRIGALYENSSNLKLSGHSLRIGGATAAVQGGMTDAQIRSIGQWKSNALDLYLRSLATAKSKASEKMGFIIQ